MKLAISKKKIMIATVFTSGLALAISQSTFAQPDSPDMQPDAQINTQEKQNTSPHKHHHINPEMQKAHEKFMDDTVAIRKQMAEKNAAMQALMKAETPDATKVSQLAGELFDLREKLRIKAQESGLPMMGRGMRKGMGMDENDAMPCQGMGKSQHMK